MTSIIFVIFNTISKYDFLFPTLFTSYITLTLYLIHKVSKKYNYEYANNLIIKIKRKIKKYGPKSKNLSETLDYILKRNK